MSLVLGDRGRWERGQRASNLVDLLDGGSAGGATPGGSTSSGRAGAAGVEVGGSAARRLVQLGDDGVADALDLLLLVVKLLLLCQLVGVQPRDHLSALVDDLLLVLLADLVLDLLVLNGGLHLEGIGLEGVLGGDAVLLLVVLVLVLLRLVHHALDLLLAQAALVVGDGDLVLLAGGLVCGGD